MQTDRRLRVTLLLMCTLATAIPVRTQTPYQKPAQASESIPTLTLKTTIVTVPAVVLSKSGERVTGLTKDDFLLKQDGKPQAIRYFSQGSDYPLTFALMVDTSSSQGSFIPAEIEASRIFVASMLTHPQDESLLVQFDRKIVELQPLTSSLDMLQHAIGNLQGDEGSGTHLYDAICQIAYSDLETRSGRKAMVLLTDGGDKGSIAKLEQAISAAQRADVVIYSVYYSFDKDAKNMEGLQKISSATGGRVYVTSDEMPLKKVYAEIAEDLRNQYLLGYHPPNSKPGRHHTIQLTMKSKDLDVEARTGYYTPD
jgi:Ca-activated chloride channel family protein